MKSLNVLVLGAVGDHPLKEIAAVDPTLLRETDDFAFLSGKTYP